MVEKLENVNIEVEVEREYNLGGFRNALKIRRKITGPASVIKENIKELDTIAMDVEIQFGNSIATSRREIKKLAKEVYAEDGTVKRKKEE